MCKKASDGCHHALSYTRHAYDFTIKHCTIGADAPAGLESLGVEGPATWPWASS